MSDRPIGGVDAPFFKVFGVLILGSMHTSDYDWGYRGHCCALVPLRFFYFCFRTGFILTLIGAWFKSSASASNWLSFTTMLTLWCGYSINSGACAFGPLGVF